VNLLPPLSLLTGDETTSEKPQEVREEKKYVLEEDGFEADQVGELLQGDADGDDTNNGIFWYK